MAAAATARAATDPAARAACPGVVEPMVAVLTAAAEVAAAMMVQTGVAAKVVQARWQARILEQKCH